MACCIPNKISDFRFKHFKSGCVPSDDCHDLDEGLASGRQRLDRRSQLTEREAPDQKGKERLHGRHKTRGRGGALEGGREEERRERGGGLETASMMGRAWLNGFTYDEQSNASHVLNPASTVFETFTNFKSLIKFLNVL